METLLLIASSLVAITSTVGLGITGRNYILYRHFLVPKYKKLHEFLIFSCTITLILSSIYILKHI